MWLKTPIYVCYSYKSVKQNRVIVSCFYFVLRRCIEKVRHKTGFINEVCLRQMG